MNARRRPLRAGDVVTVSLLPAVAEETAFRGVLLPALMPAFGGTPAAAYGAVVFVVPDMFDGCVNMQPMGVADCAPPLTPFYFFFVYFGVVINWIWLVVPVAMLVAKVRRGI